MALPPAAYSEHPKFTPLYGAYYLSTILDALTSNPDVEQDRPAHHVRRERRLLRSRRAAVGADAAGSGMSTVDVSLERHNVVTSTQTGTYTADNLPYGLGPRVPMFVVSPWSKGGFVCSQVFDHTSVLIHREALRRDGNEHLAVAPRDLRRPDVGARLRNRMPRCRPCRARRRSRRRTAVLARIVADCAGQHRATGRDRAGTRHAAARALPYELHVTGQLQAQGYALTFANTGTQGAHFCLYG